MPDEGDQADWANPDHWGDGPMGLYFSKRDRRLWVPKRQAGMGWTLNFAHPAAGLWVVALSIILPTIASLAAIVMLVVGRH